MKSDNKLRNVLLVIYKVHVLSLIEKYSINNIQSSITTI